MSDRKRRVIGFIVGLAFGAPYAWISQFINVWMLPGIPLFELPLGRMTMVVLTSLTMGILGMIVAWEEESFWGLLGGSFFIVLLSSMQAFIDAGSSQGVTSFFLFLFTFLPRLIIYLPLSLMFRWAVNRFDHNTPGVSRGIGRPLLSLLALVILAVFAGRLSLLTVDARQSLQDANALVLQGMAAAENGTDLPEALVPVDGFSAHARGAYTLEWSNDVDRLPVTRPVAGAGVTESLIIFRFRNTYQFGCAFTPPSHIPKCINITRVR